MEKNVFSPLWMKCENIDASPANENEHHDN